MLPDAPSDPVLRRRLERLGAPQGVAVALGDPAGCVEWVNGAFQRLTGYPAAELTGKRLDLFRGLDVGEPALDYVMARFRRGVRSRLEIRTRGSRRHPPRWLDVEVVPLGPDQGFAALVRDVTTSSQSDPPAHREKTAAETWRSACHEPDAPVSGPTPELTLRPADVSLLVMQSCDVLEAEISARTLLDLDLAGNLPRVQVDASCLRQVLVSLVLRADEALAGALGAIRVRTGLRREGSGHAAVELEVHAGGPARHAQLAEAEACRRRPGLSLRDIRRLVEAQAGSFEFDDSLGAGSRAQLIFPGDR